MIKLSKLTDYGVAIMAYMSQDPARLYPATDLSEELGLGKETVSKCLKLLSKADLLKSKRGASGGYVLTRPAAEISVTDVINALEGPIQLTDCIDGSGPCSLEHTCPTKGRWDKINATIVAALSKVSIQEMVNPEMGSQKIEKRKTA